MWLDASGLALVLLRVSVFDCCWLQWFLVFLLHGIYRNRQEWDTKINVMREQPNYLNLYELFTKLPLALLVF
jgi:hypothetical protein